MTLKRSFLVDITTNLKRRYWLIIVNFLILFFLFPVYTASSMSMEKMYSKGQNVAQYLGITYENYMLINPFIGFIVTFLAIVGGIQGFSYMYRRKKLDMYMSVPVSKERRFLAIYLNGLVIFITTFIVNLALAFIAAAAMEADISLAAVHIPEVLVFYIVLYFGVYNAAILSAMLTGHMAVTVLGTGVFLSIDGLYTLLITLYMGLCFKSHYSYGDIEIAKKYIITPFARFLTYHQDLYNSGYMGLDNTIRNLNKDVFFTMLIWMIISGLLFLIPAYVLYSRKPSESAGKAMAFNNSKPIVKVCVSVVLSGLAGFIMYSVSGNNRGFMYFGFAAGLLIVHGFMETIYDFDLRSCKKGLKSLVLSAIMVAAIHAVFALDITGYDRYVPKPSQVESVAAYFGDDYTNSYYNKNMEEVPRNTYLSNMKLADDSAVFELAKKRMGEVPKSDQVDDKGLYQSRTLIIAYKLKTGKTVYRIIYSMYNEDKDFLDKIVTDPGYRETVWNVYNDDFIDVADVKDIRMMINAVTGIDYEATNIKFSDFAQCYKKDLEGYSFGTQLSKFPVCSLSIYSSVPNTYVNSRYPVYDSFENTLRLLKDNNITIEPINPDMVESIEIVKTPVDDMEADVISDDYAMEIYREREQIKEILDSLAPYAARDFWTPAEVLDQDRIVYVNFRHNAGYKDQYMYNNDFRMIKEKIPAFISG